MTSDQPLMPLPPNTGSQSQEHDISASNRPSRDIDDIVNAATETPQNVQTNLLQTKLDHVVTIVEQMRDDFDTKIQYDKSKERTIDALHRALQDYREDMVFKILRPLVHDLIQYYDDLRASVSTPELQETMFAFVIEIEGILNRYGFQLFRLESDVFDRSRQKITRIVVTSDESLDGHIAESVRPGVQYGERLIRPEHVTVFKYVPVPHESSS